MKLSRRLETVISFVPARSRVADVGTDHGYVPIRLIEDGIAEHAIAMDVREGPLLRAKEHIAQYEMEDRIETRISDGLAGLKPGEADAVILAGMGGELMLQILRDGSHVREQISCFVLSPQSELELFRRGLEELGLVIRREAMVYEDGKYYTVMAAENGRMHYEQSFRYRYGDCLIRQKSETLKRFLEQEEQKLETICRQLAAQDTRRADERLAEIRGELSQIKETYDAMQGTD